MLLNNDKYCWAWDKVYIKSNGRVPCWCDAGESYTILHNNQFEKIDFVTDIVNHPSMREMRTKILLNNQYYIKECGSCCCMVDENRGMHYRFKQDEQPDTKVLNKISDAVQHMNNVSLNRNWAYGSIDRISEIQMEPSFPCNLRCGGCLQGLPDPLKTEEPPYVLPYEWFVKIVDSLVNHDVKVKRIRFVGRGEPTLNKKYPEMLVYASRMMPYTKLSMDTNANQEFKQEYLLLDTINCSIDGVEQSSYAKYRIGGVLDKALNFMRAGVELINKYESSCKIVWKYILFDVNDQLEHLNKAQQIAKQIGISELRFIMTHAGSFDGKVKPSQMFNSMKQLQMYIESNRIFNQTSGSFAT